MTTIEQMVQREVNCCMSHLVSTLCKHSCTEKGDLLELLEQACELAAPIPDYEEALLQNGWRLATDTERKAGFDAWQHESGEQSDEIAESICYDKGIEPYDREVYEFWAVSQWLAEKLIAQGEKVDTDFGGMNVWARTCSGQGIASDGVIERIHAAMVA